MLEGDPALAPKISAFPKCYLDKIAGERSMSVFDWIEQAKSLDADGLEMYEGFFTSLDPDYLDRVGEAIAASGFAMPMLCCSPDFTHPDPIVRESAVDRQAAMIHVTRRLGGERAVCRVLSGQRYPGLSLSEGLDRVVPCIEASLVVAREANVVLGLENHYKDGFWTYPEFAQKREIFLALLDAIPDRTHFGVQFDPSNALVAGDDPVKLLEEVADRVVSMHASDRYLAEGTTLDDLRQADGTLGYSPSLCHGVTGKGLNDYDAIFQILADHHYQGWISIEDGMNGMDEMAESLAFLRRMVARYFPEG
jgi:sugar phosphate isomerase/epimerase